MNQSVSDLYSEAFGKDAKIFMREAGKMAKARLMNTPEDYQKLGVDPDRIEMWEDGIRITPDRMNWEW